MAATLKTDIKISAFGALAFAMDTGGAKESHDFEYEVQWPSGTAASQANQVWSDTRTVNAAANDDLELDSLTQTDDAGATVRSVSFSVVKGLFIKNTSDADRIDVGGVGATAFAGDGYPFKDDSDIICIPAGGHFSWSDPDGVAVTNGATDILRVAGVTSNQTYTIWINGES